MQIGTKRYVDVMCYDFQIDNGGEGGKPYVVLSLRVTSGDDQGRNFTKRGYLTEKAAPITMSQLRALGWTGTKLSQAMAEGLGTRVASAQIIVKERDGKVYEEVNGIYEPKEFKRTTDNPVDASSLAAFDALFADVAAGVEVTPITDRTKAPALPASRKTTGATPAKVDPNNLGW